MPPETRRSGYHGQGVDSRPVRRINGSSANATAQRFRLQAAEDMAADRAAQLELQRKEKELEDIRNMTNSVASTTSEFGTKYVMPIMMSLSSPALVLPGITGWAGSEAVNGIVNGASEGQYETWGQMLADKAGVENSYGLMALEFTNPGAFVGGLYTLNPDNIGTTIKNARNFYKRAKHSKVGRKIRGIKYTDEVAHGTRSTTVKPEELLTYSGGDSGLHVGSAELAEGFVTRNNGVGLVFKGTLELKEAPFEIKDLSFWNVDNLLAEAQNNPKFTQYLKAKGVNLEELSKLRSKIVGEWADSDPMFKYTLPEGKIPKYTLADLEAVSLPDVISNKTWLTVGNYEGNKAVMEVLKKAGVNLKYNNIYEGGGTSYFLSNNSSVNWH